MSYVPNHCHSIFSSRDSILKPDDYIRKVKQLGCAAASITDHGNLNGSYLFQKTCEREGIKPLIGIEAYVSEAGSTLDEMKAFAKARKAVDGEELESDTIKTPLRSHLVLYAASCKGWENLLWLNNRAMTDRYYFKPLMIREELFAHSEGLICTSACIASHFSQLFEQQDARGMMKLISSFKEAFGERFFLELQLHQDPYQIAYNTCLVRFAKALGIPLILGLDAHFLDKEDAYAHSVARAMGGMSRGIQPSPPLCYVQSEEEVRANAKIVGIPAEAIENTNLLASMIDFRITFTGYHFPRTSTAEIDSLITLAKKKLVELDLPPEQHKQYQARLDEELRVLRGRDILDYFVLPYNVLQHIRANGGLSDSGRGSGAGSLFCYLVGITGVDPIQYGLIFERFLTEDRGKVELDVDF